jgi:hypothetical protein
MQRLYDEIDAWTRRLEQYADPSKLDPTVACRFYNQGLVLKERLARSGGIYAPSNTKPETQNHKTN